jgi:predicted RNA-binding protein with PIN domain
MATCQPVNLLPAIPAHARLLFVDGNNVLGATDGGWWRDPPAAIAALHARLRCYARTTGQPIALVLERRQPDLAEGEPGEVVVWYATRSGRDAADDRLVELLEGSDPASVEAVTSDRALAARVRARGAPVIGAGTFLARVADAGC